ncbi:MAG: CPBP family intramembrane metalloprotease [Lachnospiraceae bacterium]|nr:CPBP family intramembrane metalloprotease [Lachnospiraceae bacterium]
MNRKRLRTLYKKEILDVIRDKKTVLMMLVMPVILYPLIFLVVMQVVMLINQTQQEQTYYIAYDNVSDEHRIVLNDWITGDEDELDYMLKEVESDEPEKDLKEENIDVYITTKVTDSQVVYELHYLSAISDSNMASDLLKEEIDAYAKHESENNVKAAGLDVEHMLYPVKSEFVDTSSSESSIGNILGSIIPFLLIVSIMTGAMYAAVDATAGEKERGTLETLLTMPVVNSELIMSKFLSVATIAVVSVLMNVISIGGIAVYLYSTMSALSDAMGEFSVASFIPAICITIVCVIAFALFISAVAMCVCAFAKSVKEANNYISPLSLVVMFTSYVGFIPTIDLNTKTALIPVANICLLIKNLLIFKYDFTLIAIVLLSNVLYSFVAVMLLSKIYNSEAVLFGEAAGGLKLFELRRNIKKGSLPSIQESLLVMIVALLLMVYVGGIASLKYPVMGVVIPQMFIGALPVLACIYIKADMKKIFSLRLPKPGKLLGAFFLGIGTSSLSLVVSNILSAAFPSDSESLNADYLTILDGLSFVPALLLIALTPAVCEELLYRGYMFTAFKQKMRLLPAICVVAFLFAVSHMSLIKLLPTMILGIALAYAIHQSESILASGLMHFLNNGFAVFVLYYGERFPILNDESKAGGFIALLVVLAVLGIGSGIFLLKGKSNSNFEN